MSSSDGIIIALSKLSPKPFHCHKDSPKETAIYSLNN